MTVKSITAKQPILSVTDRDTGEIHFVPLHVVSSVARGDKVDDKLSQIVAKAFLQFWDE